MKCPHCLVFFHDNWTSWSAGGDLTHSDRNGKFRFESTVCPACDQLIFRLNRYYLSGLHRTGIIVYPKATARPVPDEVTKEFADDFSEACLVIADSEKASAALSRRCLQNLLREKAQTKAKDLAAQIQEVLDSGQLPSHLKGGDRWG